MARARDLVTQDMFDVPQAFPTTPGGMNFAREISQIMSQALKDCPLDRPEVAMRMTRMMGREVSLSMLNAYTAESRDMHNVSLERAIAFDAATDSYALLRFYAEKRGCRVMVGKDALYADLANIEKMEADLAKQKRAIKQFLEGK